MAQWSEKTVQALIQKALEFATADHTTVTVHGTQKGATRFARSEITQNIVSKKISLSVTSAFGKSEGRATTNLLEESHLKACVKAAEHIARITPADDEFVPPVSPVKIRSADTWRESTADLSPLERAEQIAEIVAVADSHRIEAAGSLSSTARMFAVGNSLGHFAFNRRTSAVLKCSAISDSSVGYATGYARDIAQLDIRGLAQRAAAKAIQGQSPREIRPGRYDVILEPAAVGNLLGSFFGQQMGAKATDQGRTYFSDKRDAEVVAPNIHIFSDPFLPKCPSCPFDGDGAPLKKIDWLKDRRVENLVYSRYWAKLKNRVFTGFPRVIVLAGEGVSLDKMIQSTSKGLLITRVWYLRRVDSMKELYTGMTRDGTFYIENGEVAYPVKNLRFNDSVIRMLRDAVSLGTPQNIPGHGVVRVPAMKVADFNFTSGTQF